METTLPLPFLISVDIPPGLANIEGLTREEVSILACPIFEAAPANLEKLGRFLKRHSYEFQTHIDASQLGNDDDVVRLLDQGARKVFVAPARLGALAQYGARVVPVVEETASLAAATEHGLLLKALDLETLDTDALVRACGDKRIKNLFFQAVPGTDVAAFSELAMRCGAIAILPSTALTTHDDDNNKNRNKNKNKNNSSKAPLARLIWSHVQSDRPDGLVPTVVCNEAGIALGLAYSSEASVAESIRTQAGVYQSRKRGLWVKGLTSGDTQELVRLGLDCDSDALRFVVRQTGRFCHLEQHGCFGELTGLAALERTLVSRKASAPAASYTARLFSDEKLLRAKIMEEAEELCDAQTREEVAFEAADLIYFALARAVAAGASLADIEGNLDAKSLKVQKRKGDAKTKWAEKEGIKQAQAQAQAQQESPPESKSLGDGIRMRTVDLARFGESQVLAALKRPSQKSPDAIMNIIAPIVADVRANGDRALLSYTHRFEKATSLSSPVLRAPFAPELMDLAPATRSAMDTSFDNIRAFHAAQREDKPLRVETMPGVVCSRFARAIERVGLYVPGGTAVLPSTALMLGVPAMVAGCKRIVFASPPRADGSVTPEIVYAAHRVGAEAIVLAGGAQAVAALAYGTETVPKVDKILGPGNQFVTAAKMLVSNDTNAGVGIDMPAGPSEVVVIADATANPAFVASDLLSQAEHGTDSQVVLIAVNLSDDELAAVEGQLHTQALALPRVDIVRGSIRHSLIVRVKTLDEAMRISNEYAPEHLILQIADPVAAMEDVVNAGSVFIGEWTPESVGDYSAGVNHSLPTYGYAKQYSGVNLGSFVKHITSSNLTAEGLANIGSAVMELARVEELHAHRRAVEIRLEQMKKGK